MRVSVSFQGQLGLGLGSESHVVGRLGSRVWVSASFQIFALTARRWKTLGSVQVGREIVLVV